MTFFLIWYHTDGKGCIVLLSYFQQMFINKSKKVSYMTSRLPGGNRRRHPISNPFGPLSSSWSWWSSWLTWLSACRSSRGGNRRRHPISGPHRTSAAKEVIGFHCHCHQWWERSGSRCNDNHLVTTTTQHCNADSGLRFSSARQNFALVHIPDICHFFYTGKIFGK